MSGRSEVRGAASLVLACKIHHLMVDFTPLYGWIWLKLPSFSDRKAWRPWLHLRQAFVFGFQGKPLTRYGRCRLPICFTQLFESKNSLLNHALSDFFRVNNNAQANAVLIAMVKFEAFMDGRWFGDDYFSLQLATVIPIGHAVKLWIGVVSKNHAVGQGLSPRIKFRRLHLTDLALAHKPDHQNQDEVQ